LSGHAVTERQRLILAGFTARNPQTAYKMTLPESKSIGFLLQQPYGRGANGSLVTWRRVQMILEVVRIASRQIAGICVRRIERAHPDIAQIPNTIFNRVQLIVVAQPQPVKFGEIAVLSEIIAVSQ
jgi:hypothetical protein